MERQEDIEENEIINYKKPPTGEVTIAIENYLKGEVPIAILGGTANGKNAEIELIEI